MRIAMMGSGGVGGLSGGRLAHAGYDVSLVARGLPLAAMREHGLTIENEPNGDLHVPSVRATDDPAELGRVDLVVPAVKLWDTEAAARAMRPLIGPNTGIVSLQNRVTKDDTLRREYGSAAVMAGVAYLAAHVSRPGVVRQTGTLQRVTLGEYDGRSSMRAEFLYEALNRARPWPMLAALGRIRDEAARASAIYPGRAALMDAPSAVEQHMGCAMGVCRACVVVTSEGNARVCREGPVFGLGEVAFDAGEPATIGAH